MMTLTELYDAVEKDDQINGHSVDDDGVILLVNGEKKYLVPFELIERITWSRLRDGLLGGGQLLDHMTRVVGYYSLVRNWNKSKLGELRDRQRGQYQVA